MNIYRTFKANDIPDLVIGFFYDEFYYYFDEEFNCIEVGCSTTSFIDPECYTWLYNNTDLTQQDINETS